MVWKFCTIVKRKVEGSVPTVQENMTWQSRGGFAKYAQFKSAHQCFISKRSPCAV